MFNVAAVWKTYPRTRLLLVSRTCAALDLHDEGPSAVGADGGRRRASDQTLKYTPQLQLISHAALEAELRAQPEFMKRRKALQVLRSGVAAVYRMFWCNYTRMHLLSHAALGAGLARLAGLP